MIRINDNLFLESVNIKIREKEKLVNNLILSLIFFFFSNQFIISF